MIAPVDSVLDLFVLVPARPPELERRPEVARWRVLGGATPDRLREVATVDRSGFETSAPLGGEAHVAAEALDARGRVLGRTQTLRA